MEIYEEGAYRLMNECWLWILAGVTWGTPMIRWKPAFWLRFPSERQRFGLNEMPKIASKPRLRGSWALVCMAGMSGNIRSHSRLSRRSTEKSAASYALVPLTKSEPAASVSVMEHRRKVDDVLRDCWRDIDRFDMRCAGDGESEMDGGFNPTTYGELTPSGARHLARAMGLDRTDVEPLVCTKLCHLSNSF